MKYLYPEKIKDYEDSFIDKIAQRDKELKFILICAIWGVIIVSLMILNII